MSNSNQINTPTSTNAEKPLPYKQEVGGSSPSAPTISQQLTSPSLTPDPLSSPGSGSLNETLPIPALCPCGQASDGWPGEGEAELCQDCWEQRCSDAWWEMLRHHPIAAGVRPEDLEVARG